MNPFDNDDDFANAQAQKFNTELGQGATVKRTEEKGELPQRMASMLCAIGEELNPLPKNLKYLGSAAVHIYQSEMLGQLFFASQCPLGDTPELVASAAMTDLKGAMMEQYGRARKTKRSGF